MQLFGSNLLLCLLQFGRWMFPLTAVYSVKQFLWVTKWKPGAKIVESSKVAHLGYYCTLSLVGNRKCKLQSR